MPSDNDHDRRLAARAGAGDDRAFAELVDRHRKPLLRYVARRFSPDLAEDAVQEALLSAHRALIAGTEPVDVRAWLSTIAWRRALDLSRRERDALPLDPAVAAGPADEPEARVLQATELGRVVAAMSELPPRQRQALALSALEGRSLEEIGVALDVAPDTAKSLVARSRRTLTHRLAAAELGCDTVLLRMEAAAGRGVRLSGDVTLHLRGCRACKRAHREIRRRRRVALVIPFGLLVRTAGLRDRLRDLIASNPAWEAQAGAAKLCTAACLSTLGAGTAAAPVVVPAVALTPKATATATATATPKPKHREKPRKERPTPTPTFATVRTAAPVATATPRPKAKQRAKRPRYYPPAVSTGSSPMTLKVARPAPSPVATPSPGATVSPADMPPPVKTPVPTPTASQAGGG